MEGAARIKAHTARGVLTGEGADGTGQADGAAAVRAELTDAPADFHISRPCDHIVKDRTTDVKQVTRTTAKAVGIPSPRCQRLVQITM